MKQQITLDDLLIHASTNKDKKFNLECADTCLAADLTKEWMNGWYETCKGKKIPPIFGGFCKYCVEGHNQRIFTGKQLYIAIQYLEEFSDIPKAFEATQNV